METKNCSVCKNNLPHSQFGKNKHRKDGLQSKCKSCDCEYKKRKYLENSGVFKDRARQRRADIGLWFDEYKQTLCCKNCGDARWYVLDFHHKNTNQKEYDVSHMVHYGYSKEKILEEASKCDVVCSNCHRELHYFLKMKNCENAERITSG